jgi:hypothetical protein
MVNEARIVRYTLSINCSLFGSNKFIFAPITQLKGLTGADLSKVYFQSMQISLQTAFYH